MDTNMNMNMNMNMSDINAIKYCLLSFIFFLTLCVICILCVNDDSNNQSQTRAKIIVDEQIYQKMLDVITHYSLMTHDYDEKLIVIYLATFHLFDMNYEYIDVKTLDEKLHAYPYYPNHVKFPTGNMHNNIQKAIITHISKNIDASDRRMTNDKEKDRHLLDVYLRDLFNGIDIIKNKN